MKKKMSEQNNMDKSRQNLYILYGLLATLILALYSCASDDLAAGDEQHLGNRMSLGIDVAQITGGAKTRAAAPAIKSYQMKSEGNSKPVYAQFASEAFVNRHNTDTTQCVDKQETRGASITSDDFYDRFGLFYYQYGKDESWEDIVAAGTKTPTASNMAVEKKNGWLTDKYWPGANYKLTFMAYAPFNSDYTSISVPSASNIKGYPKLTYTVPTTVANQKDIVVSAEAETQDIDGDYNKVISMKFYHVLSAINFKIGSTMAPCRIDKIEIQGVYSHGVYDFATKKWGSINTASNYSIAPNYVVTDERSVVFTGVDDTKNDLLLLMPQTLPAAAKLVVTIGDGANYATQRKMELSLAGHEWLPGYTITYTLSTAQENSDYVFSVSKISSIDKAATTVKYNVNSFVQSYYGSQSPVGWKAMYAVDDQVDNDEYSTELGDVVNGSFVFDMPSPTASTSSLTAKISELEPPVSDPANNTHTAKLRATTPLGTAKNPYDLSTLGGTRSQSTANCYIVHAPGWYKIPLVYGNCIKNGTNNTAVYGTSTEMANFVNHLNKQISNPWLVNNENVSPSEAVLVWQDAYKMIATDSLGITSDKRYLFFKVNQDFICQGNALLSVRDANKKILWSWHIWVTDEDFSSATNIPVTNFKNSVYDFMPVPLGHCQPDRRYYKNRNIKFHFIQENSGLIADVNFAQSTTTYLEYGQNATYYQFGRSTPIEALGTGMSNTFKTLYDNSEYPWTYEKTDVSRGTAIQNPSKNYNSGGNYDWNTKEALNVWDAQNKTYDVYDKATNTSVKTIYDPCPVGYKIPEPEAFTGFTSTGENTTSNAYFNYLKWDSKYGFTFYTKPQKQGGTITIYTYNRISNNTKNFTEIFQRYAFFWTTGCDYIYSNGNSFKCGKCFSFCGSGGVGVYPKNKIYRSFGQAILPVADN